jgi:hypothetical protein
MTKSIHAGVHKPQASEAISLADAAMLDKLQRTAFNYFPSSTNTQNGLVADRMRDGSPSTIAVVGLALSCYPVGVERGWIDRDQARIVQKENRHSSGCDPMVVAEHSAEALSALNRVMG